MVTNLTEEQISHFKEVFDMFDADGGGSISVDELQEIFEQLGQFKTEEEINNMIKEVDEDKSGEIDFEEFL